jgi:hypothetical protein
MQAGEPKSVAKIDSRRPEKLSYGWGTSRHDGQDLLVDFITWKKGHDVFWLSE